MMNMNCFQNRPWRIAVAILCGIWVLLTSRAAFAGDSDELFLKNCAACHGKDGKAESPIAKKLGVKDLSQSKLTDAQIKQQIRDGMQARQSAAKMPAFKDRLTEDEINSLIAVVKEFRPRPKQEAEPTR
jgi:mono/diheme cytochrome c family protein